MDIAAGVLFTYVLVWWIRCEFWLYFYLGYCGGYVRNDVNHLYSFCQ